MLINIVRSSCTKRNLALYCYSDADEEFDGFDEQYKNPLKVAAYCRIEINYEEQKSSHKTQINYCVDHKSRCVAWFLRFRWKLLCRLL